MKSKLPQITTSIFSKMTLLAKKHSAINLSQGFPDFPMNQELIRLIESGVKKNIHQYCPSSGHNGLLEQINVLLYNSYQRNINEALSLDEEYLSD